MGSNMKDHKIDKRFVYEGLGFPVILFDVPMVNLRGEWALDIDMNRFQRAVLLALAHHPFDLTGDHIRFIRSWLRLSYARFGSLFGVTHAAVVKWEKSSSRSAKIAVTTQREIRLHILDKILKNDCEFRNAYRKIQNVDFQQKSKPIKLDASTDLVAIGQ